MKPLPEDLILDDLWIPMQLLRAGKRTTFVAEAEAHDAAFENEREFRRKVRTLAGNYQLYARMPELLVPFTNPLWFETISHKIMRLVAPWLLVALAALSAVGAAAGNGGMTAPSASFTPATSVRKMRVSAWQATAQAEAIWSAFTL